MKRKMIIGSIAGFVVLGGAMGVAASSKSDMKNEEKTSNIISVEEAKEIAINEVGGQLKGIEFDKEDGRLIYEVDLFHANSDDDDVDVDIDAVSGEVIHVDRDDDDQDDDEYKYERSDARENVKISHEEAIAIALKDTPGKVKEAELDDDGYYEIEIKNGKTEVEMKVDADSGKIIEKETDRD